MTNDLFTAVWEYTGLGFDEWYRQGVDNRTEGQRENWEHHEIALKLRCRFRQALKFLKILAEASRSIKKEEKIEQFWGSAKSFVTPRFENSCDRKRIKEIYHKEIDQKKNKLEVAVNYYKQLQIFECYRT